MALLRRMGQPVLKDCLLCSSALHADEPIDICKLNAKGGVYLHECGRILHIMCQAKSEASDVSGTTCPVCVLGRDQEDHQAIADGDDNRQQ